MAAIEPMEAQVSVDVDKRALAALVPEGRKRFDKQGLLALEPKAFFDLFFIEPPPENQRVGDTEVVTIRGPLEFHSSWFDSYEDILSRVGEACASDAKNVVLRVDSPGGDALGVFSAARAIREKCAASGKRLWTYIEGTGCSAAYALACAGEYICADPSAIVGSIGVISTRVDLSGLDDKMGVKVHVITSGTRKGDGHPSVPMSDEELAAAQSMIDALASQFAELVSECRGDMSAADVLALEAGVFTGADAKKNGLVDSTQSLESMLADLAGGQPQPSGASMATKYEEGRAALEEAAKGDDEEAKKAQRALAAMDEPEPDPEDEESPDAKGKDDMPFDPKKGDDEEEKKEKAASRASFLALSKQLAGPEAKPKDLRAAVVLALEAATKSAERATVAASAELDAIRAELAEVKAASKAAREEQAAIADAKRTTEINAHIDAHCRATKRVNSKGEILVSERLRERVIKSAKQDGESWKAAVEEMLEGVPSLPTPPSSELVSNPDAKTPKGGVPMTQREALDIVFNRLRAAQTDEERAKPNSAAPLRRKASQLAPKEFPELWRTESPAAE